MNSLRAGMLSCARNPDNVRMRMIARSSLTLETRKLEYADERKGQRCVKAGDGGSNSYIYILVSMHRPRGGHLGFPPQLRAARTPRTVHAGESRLRSPRPGSPSVTPAEFGFARHVSWISDFFTGFPRRQITRTLPRQPLGTMGYTFIILM